MGAGEPCLTLRTCRVAVAKSIWSQRRSVSSLALRPQEAHWRTEDVNDVLTDHSGAMRSRVVTRPCRSHA